MTHTIERPKWILYRHTSDFGLITTVAVNLKFYSKTSISPESKKEQLLELRNLGYYKERNPELPLDSISHRINTLEYYMFGYKDKVDGNDKFMFNPLGNLFLKNIKDKNKISKIFFSMLWGVQFPNNLGTDPVFQIFPFRLIFKLLCDERLGKKLFAFEVAYYVVFIETINERKYEKLVKNILEFRKLSNEEIERKFKDEEHVLVNATYEWDYYVSKFLVGANILEKKEGEVICTLNQGKSTTRKLTKNVVTLNKIVESLYEKLEKNYPFSEKPLLLNDPEQLSANVTKDIHSFFPEELLEEIGEQKNKIKLELLNLPKLIEKYAENHAGKEWGLFEEVLVDGFNSFYNVEARGLGGAGKTDVECLYITKKTKFAVDGKSTKAKLSSLNAGRLAKHRRDIGATYTIVVTPRYVPSVKFDIKGSDTVIILASTFSEYLYNHFDNDVREIDYMDFDEIITSNLGTDVSRKISDLTLNKFASRTK